MTIPIIVDTVSDLMPDTCFEKHRPQDMGESPQTFGHQQSRKP
jgi:hypothetical protein